MLNTTLAELISTRINHDIIGNIGAVANAVELLEEGDADFMDDIGNILKVSSLTLNARLKFFRLAFGMEATIGNPGDLEEVIKNYLKTIGNSNYPISLDLNIDGLSLYKPVMLLAMTASDVFIKGGNISIVQKEHEIEFNCTSEYNMNLEKIENVKSIIDSRDAEVSAKFAPVYYLKELLINMVYDVSIDNKESFKLTISKGV